MEPSQAVTAAGLASRRAVIMPCLLLELLPASSFPAPLAPFSTSVLTLAAHSFHEAPALAFVSAPVLPARLPPGLCSSFAVGHVCLNSGLSRVHTQPFLCTQFPNYHLL